MWEQVHTFYLMVREAVATHQVTAEPHAFFTALKRASHLFLGIADATVAHNEAWHCGHMGSLIERADKTSRLLDGFQTQLHHVGQAMASTFFGQSPVDETMTQTQSQRQ